MLRAFLIFLFVGVLITTPTSAHADGLMYMDEAGNIFFVDRPDQVPERYRRQLTPTPKAVYLDEKSRKEMEKTLSKQQRNKEKDSKRKMRIEERERKKQQKEEEAREKRAAKQNKAPAKKSK